MNDEKAIWIMRSQENLSCVYIEKLVYRITVY